MKVETLKDLKHLRVIKNYFDTINSEIEAHKNKSNNEYYYSLLQIRSDLILEIGEFLLLNDELNIKINKLILY